MAGYTRQSAASIVALATISASPLNAEFNQLQSAFNGTTGHSHSGAAGEGPKVDLAASVTGLLPSANLADATLVALSAYNTNGILTQTAADTFTGRTITGTSSEITVTDGNGVAANPTISLPASLVFTGKTISNGTYSSPTLSNVLGTTTLASGHVFSWNTGDVTLTHAANTLTFGGASNGYFFDVGVKPISGASLGFPSSAEWSSLYLTSTSTINWGNSNSAITNASGVLTVNPGDLRITTPGTNSASVVTVGGTQTLTSKTLTTPTITLKQSASPTPTAEGDIQWDTDDNSIVVGDGAAAVTFRPVIAPTETAASGTSVDFTGIPSWATEIKLVLQGISTNGSANLRVQLGDSGGIEAAGYGGAVSVLTSTVTTTVSSGAGFDFGGGSSTMDVQGTMFISRAIASATTWVISGTFSTFTSTITNWVVNGEKATSATLDRIRVTTANGTDTFDAGVLTVSYR